ncbi:MAG: alpha/beta hydrolase [Candidatus Saccharimonadales bacterium]
MSVIEQLEAGPPAQGGPEPSEPIAIRTMTGETSIGGQDVRLTYREPRDPSDITDPVVLLIAHGWNAPESAYGPLAEAVASLGKPSLTYEEDRSLGLVGDLNPLNLLRVAALASKAAWAATRFARDELGYDKAHGYGHSLGGKTVVNLALNHSDHMRGLVLDGSVGLNHHRLPGMVGRTGQFAVGEVVPALGTLARSHGPKTGLHVARYMWRHPGRTLAEGVDAGSSNLHEGIARLLYRGIPVSVVQSRNDIYFAHGSVHQDSGHLFGEHFHLRDDPDSNHLAPQLDPRGTAELIMHALGLQLEAEAEAAVAA